MIGTRGSNQEDLNQILSDEEINGSIFNLTEGRVFRTHAIRRSTNLDEDLLMLFDLVVFNFHHVAFDGASIDTFFLDLQQTYLTDEPLEPGVFDYIDSSVYEKEMNFDQPRFFWKDQFSGLTNPILSLP